MSQNPNYSKVHSDHGSIYYAFEAQTPGIKVARPVTERTKPVKKCGKALDLIDTMFI
jgi:hypothetical protein